MSAVAALALALPQHTYTSEQILAAARQWLRQSPSELALFERFVQSSRIEQRSFAIPIKEIVGLRGIKQRSEIFGREGTALATQAVEKALADSSISPSDVGALVFSSCTAPLIPSPDVGVMNALGFPEELLRVPLYQHGCVGGAVGLSLARQFAEQGMTTLVVAVELCSLSFQGDDLSGGSLVGTALFADGAACAVVRPGGSGLGFVDAATFLIPEAQHLMGFDFLDDGWHLRLDKDLPSMLTLYLQRVIPEFLFRNGVAIQDVRHWLLHPGGAKILDATGEAFGLDREVLRWSWNVLSRYGNLSSATVLFVLHDFLRAHEWQKGEHVLLFGVGPGLTVQLILFRCDS